MCRMEKEEWLNSRYREKVENYKRDFRVTAKKSRGIVWKELNGLKDSDKRYEREHLDWQT